MKWKIRLYDLENDLEARHAEAKIESILQMWRRETPKLNKSTKTGQIKSEYGDYFFDIQLYENLDILVIKEKSVFQE